MESNESEYDAKPDPANPDLIPIDESDLFDMGSLSEQANELAKSDSPWQHIEDPIERERVRKVQVRIQKRRHRLAVEQTRLDEQAGSDESVRPTSVDDL